MSVVNQIRFFGHLGADAVKNTSTSGKPVVNFRVAVDDSYKKNDGTWENRSVWYDCVLWADRKIEDLKSGVLVAVQGVPRPNEYTKKDGTKGFGIRVTVDGLKVFKDQK